MLVVLAGAVKMRVVSKSSLVHFIGCLWLVTINIFNQLFMCFRCRYYFCIDLFIHAIQLCLE